MEDTEVTEDGREVKRSSRWVIFRRQIQYLLVLNLPKSAKFGLLMIVPFVTLTADTDN
jgi:hypothetical protein